MPWRLAFGMLGPPLIWAVHFVVIYSINALICWAGLAGWTLVGGAGHAVVIGLVTLAALTLIGWAAWLAHRARRAEGDDAQGDSWRAYMGRSGLLLAGLFALAVVLETVPVFVLAPCA